MKRFILLLALTATAFAQEESVPPPMTSSAEVEAGDPARREAIGALVNQIRSLADRLASKRDEAAAAPTDQARAELHDEARDLERQVEAARLSLLEIVATDVDLSEFESVEEKPFSLQGAIEDLVKPLVEELNRVTANSRESRALRERYEVARDRAEVVGGALEALDETISSTTDPDALEVLGNLRASFGARFDDARNELVVLRYRLDQIDAERQSVVRETSGVVGSFFRERGRNLVLALLAAATVFLGMRFLHRHLHDNTAFFRQGRTFSVRVVDLALAVFTFLGALLAASVVLLVAGDWVLMSVVILLVLVSVLLAKDALPGFMDEARMLLNLGPVRESERIVYNGVPWLVENLTFFTTLRNPALHGMVRMPIAQLAGMLSRPEQEAEPYFPCETRDWVVLDDGTFGQVVFQSVEMVRLELRGGAWKTFPTDEFLEQNPQNLSHGFRVRSTIGIDYAHQAECTTAILGKLGKWFDEAVPGVVPRAHIRSLKVEFALANASSLDYVVLLDMNGEMASKWNMLKRALQRIGVDACNEFGLGIPFQQVTIHQGA